MDARFRIFLVAVAAGLFSVFVVGLAVLATSPLEAASLTLAFTAGLSMIVLPCTLPAVLVIVPLSMGRGARKGFAMAGLFGLGLTLTIGGYAVAVAGLGRILYLDQVTLWMWFVAAVAAYLFGLTELGLLRVTLPAYAGPLPGVIDRHGDYLKAFGMGLLLGNAGIGCPNPAFYVMLAYIAGTGSLETGAIYGIVHGLGRATPLLALSALALLGVNATRWLLTRREAVQHAVGWGLVAFGALLIPKGLLFGHAFWEESVIHKVWNGLVHRTLGPNIAESVEVERVLGDMAVESPWLLFGPWVVIALLLALPVVWRNLRDPGAAPARAPAARLAGLFALVALAWPEPAWAHGSNDVTLTSFVGPAVGLATFLVAVAAGRLARRVLGCH